MASGTQLSLLATSIFLGVLFPALASLFKPVLYPTIFLLFFFAVLQVRFVDALHELLRNRAASLILAWQLVGLPLLAAVLLAPILGGHWYLFTLVTLTTSSITATTALARIFNLNDAMALSVCVLGTLLMPLPLYVVINFIVDIDVNIDIATYAIRILIYIVVPFLLVWLIRFYAREQHMSEVERLTPTIVLGLLMVFGLCVMDGVREMIHTEPAHLLSLVLLAFAISIVVQLTTFGVLRVFGERDMKTACLLCAYRNMGVVAAITGTSTGSALGEYFLIFVGVWQLPMYILPYMCRRFYQYK